MPQPKTGFFGEEGYSGNGCIRGKARRQREERRRRIRPIIVCPQKFCRWRKRSAQNDDDQENAGGGKKPVRVDLFDLCPVVLNR